MDVVSNAPSPGYVPPQKAVDRFFLWLIYAQKRPVIGRIAAQLLRLRGIDIKAKSLTPGDGLILRHSGNVVIHGQTRLGSHVMLHQGVTVGRSDIWRPPADDFEGFIIEDHVILCANAVVTSGHGLLTVGEGTVVGANSVLTTSTGKWEIWAGGPARKVGDREPRT